jgi:hypothetical protein
MKLQRGILWATAATAAALAVGGVVMVTVVGIDRPDPRVGEEQVGPESTAVDDDGTKTASNEPGTEEYRGGFHGGASHGGASRGGGYGHTVGWGRGAYGHVGGWGHGYGRGWGGSRWGRWGGGRWVGRRWVAGNYFGWCDDRRYACERAWW